MSTVLWCPLNQPAVVGLVSSLLMRDKLHGHNCACVHVFRLALFYVDRMN